MNSFELQSNDNGISSAPKEQLLLLEAPSGMRKFFKKNVKTFLPPFIIGGFFILLVIVAAFFLRSYNSNDSLAKYVSSDVLMYAQIKDSMFRSRANDGSDPFLQELYQYFDSTFGPSMSLSDDIIPNIYREGAIILVKEGTTTPIALIRSKNIKMLQEKFPNNVVLAPEVIAFSSGNAPIKKYVGKFNKTVESEYARYGGKKYSFIKIFLNIKKMNLGLPLILSAVITLDKKERWEFEVLYAKKDSASRYLMRENYLENGGAKHDYSAYFHNIPAIMFMSESRAATYPLFDRPGIQYATREILPKISNFIDFGYIMAKNSQKDSFMVKFNLLRFTDEDEFILKLRTFLAYLYPEFEKKVLLDNTEIYEEVLRPEFITFELINKSKGLYGIHLKDKAEWYYKSDGKIISISNSLEDLDDIENGRLPYDNKSEHFIVIKSEFIKSFLPMFNGWDYLDRGVYIERDENGKMTGYIR